MLASDWASQVMLVVLACQCSGYKRRGFHPWVRKILWRRAWQPTPVFLPRESHGQRSLAGYSPWGGKELDMTEAGRQASDYWDELERIRCEW